MKNKKILQLKKLKQISLKKNSKLKDKILWKKQKEKLQL